MELKVVIQLKPEWCIISVQESDHDPVMEAIKETLSVEQALTHVSPLLEVARARWATHPKNPAYKRPEPPPLPPRPAAAARTPASTEPKEGLMQRLM